MKISRISGQEERAVLCGLIVDPVVLGRVSAKWRGRMFEARWSNLIAKWCIEYFQQYGKAPRKHIQGLFASWASANENDKDTVALVERYLGSLNDEYSALARESNSDYVTDLAGKHFTRVALRRLFEEGMGDIDAGDVKAAQKRVTEFSVLEMGAESPVNVLQDKVAVQEALEEDTEGLIEFPGALGQFFANYFQREGFIALQGPDKVGKSFWLEEIAWRGVLQRRKVAYFSVGDLSQRQMMRRFIARAARRPVKAGEYWFPLAIRKRDGKNAEVRRERRVARERMDWREAMRAFNEVVNKTRTSHPLLKLSTYAMGKATVPAIEAELDEWEREGWVPDVVVIDYADILEETEGDDERGRTNQKWKRLRGLSQTRHILLVTATQSDADAYTAHIQRKSNFSDDKRKLAHVTGFIGINQNDDEKKLGVQRLNWIVLREGSFHESTCVYVAGSFAMASAAIRSCWPEHDSDAEK